VLLLSPASAHARDIFSIIFLYRAFIHYLPPSCSPLQPSSVESSSSLQRQVAASRRRLSPCHFRWSPELGAVIPAVRSQAQPRCRSSWATSTVLHSLARAPPLGSHLSWNPFRPSSPFLAQELLSIRAAAAASPEPSLQRVHEGSVRKSKAIPTNYYFP
jgi:hypothetical protein